MTGNASPAHFGDFLPPWARWVWLAVFAMFAGLGLISTNPGFAAAAAGAVVAIAAAALLAGQRRSQFGLAAAATAGVAVFGHGMSSNVGWFTTCLLATWCVLTAGRRAGLAYWAVAQVLFAVEWVWIEPDPGWGAWMAGVTLTFLAGLLIRHEADLVAQLRAAQAGMAEQARAQERNRIARELHDVIAHTLTVSLLHVSSARLAVEHDPQDAARALAEAERLGRESLDEVRLAVGMLHRGTDAGPTAPLPGAGDLPALVARFDSAGADVSLSIEGETGGLPATVGLALYRILQEALTNVVKHAPGAPAAVRLVVAADETSLEVDSAAPAGTGSGMGVLSMRERAESLGGTCQAGPGGRGWLVRAVLPVSPGHQPAGGQPGAPAAGQGAKAR